MRREVGQNLGVQRRAVPISLLQMEGKNMEVMKRCSRIGSVRIPWVIQGVRPRAVFAQLLGGVAPNLASAVQVVQQGAEADRPG
jgi:hypothetical protein